jgi:amino acid transporter
MIYSLVICTVLYILIALVLTGMVNYSELKVPDPLAYVFHKIDQKWISYIISISAVVATTSVMLVFQVGQPRIWMSMSRDGLLPKRFSEVHKKYKTPSYATIITGVVVGVPTLFMPMDMMTDLTSIGTLFAFVLVSAGVLLLPTNENKHSGFRLPYINGRFIVPILFIVFVYLMKDRIATSAQNLGKDSLQEVLFLVYMVIGAVLSALTFIRSWSMIPILGVLSCAYLLIEIPAISWVWFFIWMAIGLVIYFMYGYRKSRLASQELGIRN